MSIDAVSPQQAAHTSTTRAAASPAPAFTLEPDMAPAGTSRPVAKPLGVMSLTSADMQARMAQWEAVRPEMEAREKAWRAQLDGYIDYVKSETAARNDQPYGQVTRNGEVVATVYNSGAMSGPGSTQIDWNQPLGMTGPDLARWRAEQISKATGGTFVGLDTAETQDAWGARQANNTPIMKLMDWGAANGFADVFDALSRSSDIRA
jgi:hypothetical protein